MSENLQYRAHAVVCWPRRYAASLALALLGTLPLDAGAAAPRASRDGPDPTEVATPPITPSISPHRHSYAGLLSMSYVFAPLAALGVGTGVSQLTNEEAVLIPVVGGMFMLPAVVHMAHGKVGHGLLSTLELAGLTFAGVLAGGLVGGLITHRECGPDENSDYCDFSALPGLIVGSFVGGIAGYTAFAIYDVSVNGEALVGATRGDARGASVHLWLAPTPAPPSTRGDASPKWSGLWMGATLQL